MKKKLCLFLFLCAGIIFSGASSCLAQQAKDHPAPDVDGAVWMNSTDQEKKAFLFGASSAVVLEYHVREKHSEEPSLFIKGWVEGLKDMSWTDLANRIDTYYRNNPDQIHRHMFDVIWHEVIMPNWKG
jgi:hypothetical protein